MLKEKNTKKTALFSDKEYASTLVELKKTTLPNPQSDLAHRTLKDPYTFDFLEPEL